MSTLFYGLARSVLWPLLLITINHHTTPHHTKQSNQSVKSNITKLILTLWSNAYESGSVLGFFVSNILVYEHHFGWENTYILSILLNIAVTVVSWIILKIYIDNEQRDSNQH